MFSNLTVQIRFAFGLTGAQPKIRPELSDLFNVVKATQWFMMKEDLGNLGSRSVTVSP
jgi:hypothetical protein